MEIATLVKYEIHMKCETILKQKLLLLTFFSLCWVFLGLLALNLFHFRFCDRQANHRYKKGKLKRIPKNILLCFVLDELASFECNILFMLS